MAEEQATPKSPARKGAGPENAGSPAEADLSQEIARMVEREPMDQVRCVRVFGNYYRCNWWSRLGGPRRGLDYDWAGLITDYIRKSRFLAATMETGKLVINEVHPAESYTRDFVANAPLAK